MWTPARDSTPRASIVHPFAPTSPAVRVNGPTSSSVARSRCSPAFRPTRERDQRCARPTNANHTPTIREPVASFGYRPRRACALAAGAWCVSRRATRFGDPLALLAVGFVPPHGRDFENCFFERPTSDTSVASPVVSPRSRDDEIRFGRDRFPRPPREERTASTTRGAFHRDDAERPATPLPLREDVRLPRRRFRGLATAARRPTLLRPARSPALG